MQQAARADAVAAVDGIDKRLTCGDIAQLSLLATPSPVRLLAASLRLGRRIAQLWLTLNVEHGVDHRHRVGWNHGSLDTPEERCVIGPCRDEYLGRIQIHPNPVVVLQASSGGLPQRRSRSPVARATGCATAALNDASLPTTSN